MKPKVLFVFSREQRRDSFLSQDNAAAEDDVAVI